LICPHNSAATLAGFRVKLAASGLLAASLMSAPQMRAQPAQHVQGGRHGRGTAREATIP